LGAIHSVQASATTTRHHPTSEVDTTLTQGPDLSVKAVVDDVLVAELVEGERDSRLVSLMLLPHRNHDLPALASRRPLLLFVQFRARISTLDHVVHCP